ncbi:MAG: hypothetical protein ACLSHU_05025 [Oscillospiraceae bacterium]
MATLIFDEVDTGVSSLAGLPRRSGGKSSAQACQEQAGSTASPSARDCRPGGHPTCSSPGKGSGTDGPHTTVTPLDREGRKLELARIIGGASITEITPAGAGGNALPVGV